MKTTLLAMVAISFGMVTQAIAEEVTQNIEVGALTPTCTFSNTVVGTLVYDENTDTFAVAGGSPSSVDVFYRNMDVIQIVNDGTLGSITDAYSSADYQNASTALGTTSFTNTGPLTAQATLTPNVDGNETLTIAPTLTKATGVLLSQNTTYTTSYTVTCIE